MYLLVLPIFSLLIFMELKKTSLESLYYLCMPLTILSPFSPLLLFSIIRIPKGHYFWRLMWFSLSSQERINTVYVASSLRNSREVCL